MVVYKGSKQDINDDKNSSIKNSYHRLYLVPFLLIMTHLAMLVIRRHVSSKTIVDLFSTNATLLKEFLNGIITLNEANTNHIIKISLPNSRNKIK